MSDDPLLRGLARNPAAPPGLLLRLLAAAPAPTCDGLTRRRDLPAAVQHAMAHHRSPRVRSTLAEHPQATPEFRRLLLADPEIQVVVRAFGRPGQQPFGDDVLSELLGDLPDIAAGSLLTEVELAGELKNAMGYDPRLYRLSATHPDPQVRATVAGLPAWLDEPSRVALLADPVPEIRAVITAAIAEDQRDMQPADLPDQHGHAFWHILQRPLSRALVEQVVADDDTAALYYVAANPSTPPDVVQALLRHPDREVRERLTGRPDLSREQLLELAGDPAVEVRTAISVHPGLTEQQRAGIDIDLTTDEGDGHYGPKGRCHWSMAHHHTYERARPLADAVRWVGSVNPLLRRRAACHPELPAEFVAALADDPDLGVRVLLAQHHPDAPPELLLRCYLEYHGCGRERLAELPRFPADGLAAFAGHSDPAVRRLVGLDPLAAPDLIERLSADPDATVREAMATCPRLPAARLVALLGDPELAEAAAANPALPVDQWDRILHDALSDQD
jgi:hypothetical protein